MSDTVLRYPALERLSFNRGDVVAIAFSEMRWTMSKVQTALRVSQEWKDIVVAGNTGHVVCSLGFPKSRSWDKNVSTSNLFGRERSQWAQGMEVKAAERGKPAQDALIISYHYKHLGLTLLGSLWERTSITQNHQNEKWGSWDVCLTNPTSWD